MKNKNLKEYFGTQRPSFAGGPGAGSNFYSGADLGAHTQGRLGTRGADSKFSQRMQFAVPNDYYDLLEEDEEEIDEDYVVENTRYSLNKILDLNESITDVIAAAATDTIGDLGRSAASALTPTIGSVGFAIKNMSEIKKGRDKTDILIQKFLGNANDKVVEEMDETLDGLITDIIDLFQVIIESLPDPSGEFVTAGGTILLNAKRIKDALSNNKKTIKIVLRFINPAIQFIVDKFDSIPGMATEDQSIILGTLRRIVLLADLVEDYNLQKDVHESLGLPPNLFRYRHHILSPGQDIEDYDHIEPYSEADKQKRMRTERDLRKREYSYSERTSSTASIDASPDDESDDIALGSPEPTLTSKEESLLDNPWVKLFIKRKGDTSPTGVDLYRDLKSRFSESLEGRNLQYLLEDDDLEEEIKPEGDELEEFSGAGAVAGFSLPLGASPRGPKGQHSSTSGGKAYPYSPSDRSAFNKFSKKTFGGK